jgi:hypothetical protein
MFASARTKAALGATTMAASAAHARPTLTAVAVLAVAACTGLATSRPVHADDSAPHNVIYSVTADQPAAVSIYYRDAQPTTWADYSHNPYQFSPRDDIQLEPGKPWTRQATLADPAQWAMVTVTTAGQSPPPIQSLHCTLTIDGTVVDRADGPRGALCSLRNW